MKKLMILLFIPLVLACDSDNEPNCDCGTVEDYGWDYVPEEIYLLDILNECTGEIYTIQVTYNVFSDYAPFNMGDRLCNISEIRLD